MPGARPLQAIICDFDGWHRQAVAQLLEEHGFEILGEAEFAVEALHLVEALHPTLVVITQESSGLSGLDALPELLAGDDPPEVLLLANDDRARDAARAAGAFDLAVKGETDLIERLLDEVRELLETGERRSRADRRSGTDRREKQDWSKVTTERRSGEDRRAELRRDDDASRVAKDIVAHRVRPTEG